MNILRQLFAAMRFRAPAQLGKIPLLMLAGEHDKLVNVACSRALASLWHCPLQIHAQAGHDLPLDDGAWVIRQVLDWQKQLNPAPAPQSENLSAP